MVDISVIIPNLHSPIISQTISALVQQDFQGTYEIIVAGQDKYNYIQEFPSVQFVETSNPVNPAKARNLGIRVADGDIFAFLDADCIPLCNWLSSFYNVFKDSKIDVVGGGIDFPKTNYWSYCDNLASFYEYSSTLPPGRREQLPSLNLMVRRSALEETGYFDEQRVTGEDSDLTTRLRLNGFDLHFIPDIQVSHISQRKNIIQIIKRFYTFGRYSIKVDKEYQKKMKIHKILHFSSTTLIFSPILAAGVSMKVLLNHWKDPKTWLSLPIVFLAKLVWCFGASRTLKHGYS